jgi:hypothetical protein
MIRRDWVIRAVPAAAIISGPAMAASKSATAGDRRSLGDPARLGIVRRLAAGEARVVDLTRALWAARR